MGHYPFDIIFFQRPLVTPKFSLFRVAGIVVVDLAMSTGSALTVHRSPTMTAEQLSRQEVIYLSLAPCGGCGGLRKPPLYRFKQLFINDGGNTIFDDNILVGISADVTSVTEHGLKAAAVELRVFGGLISGRVKLSANISYAFAVGVKRERFLNDVSGVRVNDQLVIFHLVPKGNMTAYTVALQGRLTHTSRDLL